MLGQKRKLVHISTHYYPVNGGQQIYIKKMIDSLSGFDHVVIQINNEGLVHPEYVEVIDTKSVFCYKAAEFYVFNYRLGDKLKRMLEDGVVDSQNDVVVCHYAFHYSVVKAIFKNVVILSHGVEWDGPGSLLKKAYHYHRKVINYKLLRDANVFIVANDINYFNQLGLGDLDQSFYYKEVLPRKYLVPNTVDTNVFKPLLNLASPFHKKAIIIPRNIVPQRGIDCVINSFSELSDRSWFGNYCLYVVGEVYDLEYYNKLLVSIQSKNLMHNVCFFGSQSREKMPLIYNAAELTVIFSLYREGTSLAALESMACGTPVISSAVGGLIHLPTRKATRTNLAEVIETALLRAGQLGEDQRSVVNDVYSDAKWALAWNGILEKSINYMGGK